MVLWRVRYHAWRAWKWVSDWRNMSALGGLIVGSILAALLVVTVIEAIKTRQDTIGVLEHQIAAGQEARRASTARISELIEETRKLNRQVAQSRQAQGRMLSDIRVLQRQLRNLGIEPIVVEQRDPSRQSGRAGQDSSTPSTTDSRRRDREPDDRSTEPRDDEGPRQPRPAPTRSPRPPPPPAPPPSGEEICIPLTGICVDAH